MAKRLGVSPSTISRAIKGKSLDCQWGEKPLKDFFPTPKRFKKELLRQALQEGQLSDEGIRLMMRDKLGVSLSRRYIAALRKELKIPARGKRGGKWR
jgi:DNA-directed RNA polymerase specialized sigma54-like protein